MYFYDCKINLCLNEILKYNKAMSKRSNTTFATHNRLRSGAMLSMLVSVMFMLLGSKPAKAADDEKLLMKITTLTDTLRFSVAADEFKGTIKVDYGDGNLKSFDIPNMGKVTEITGITKSTEKERVVKVYGDENLINSFKCVYYGLTALDLSGCAKLTDITVDHNMLTTLDVSKNTELLWLNAKDNQIKTITFPATSKLQTLWLDSNELSSINLSGMPDLIDLRLFNCTQLRSLNVSSNTKLKRLDAGSTGIYSINVANNPELMILDVSLSNVYSIDVSKNPKLTQLGVGHLPNSNYKLSSIDVSNNPDLFYLNASGNRIKEVDLSKNPELQVLNIWENQLTSIDLTNNPKVQQILIRDNYLNFNNLPLGDNLTYYIYNPQKPVKVDTEYPKGGELDLSKEVYNPDYSIEFSLYLTSSNIHNDPGKPLVEGEDYSFDKGVVKFLKSQSDSVYCSVTHEKFPDMALKTTKFLVREPEDMGKSMLAFEFTPDTKVGDQMLLRIAAYQADSKIEVDFGDGVSEQHTIGLSSSSNILGNLKGKTVKVYTLPGTQIKEINLGSSKVKSIDLSRLHALRTIDLSNNLLTDIDFSGNFVLETVKISKNQLTSLEFSKNNVLNSVDCSENKLTNLVFKEKANGVTALSCNVNELENLDVSALYMLSNLQARSNKLKELRLFNNSELTTLYVDNNDLEMLDLSQNPNLNFVSITNNYFKFSTLPSTSARYFTYNQQKEISIATIGHSVDLASEMTVHDKASDTDINTVYVWKDVNGNRLYDDEDYSIKDGITTFLGPNYESKEKAYCELTNRAYPGMTLKTTAIQPADLPSVVLAEIDVKSDKGTAVHLNMAAGKPLFVYVDYGDGEMKECSLKTTYKIFDATLGSEQKIKIYCYDVKETPLTVLSLQNIDLNGVDLSKLSELTCLNLSGTGLKTLDISKNPKLEELLVSDNRLSEIDLSNNPALWFMDLRNNRFTEIPAGLGENLTWLIVDNNKIEKADLSAMKNIRTLSASGNQLETIDLTANDKLEQVSLDKNALTSVTLPENDVIRVLYLGNNKLTFSDLPPVKENCYYTYAPQADVEITPDGNKVDLASEYDIDGTITEYVWKDSSKDLTAGTDYKFENGVTEFLVKPEGQVSCVMTNSLYPDLVLTTVPVDIELTSISAVGSDSYRIAVDNGTIRINYSEPATTEICNLAGQTVRNLGENIGEVAISDLVSGVYIVRHVINGTVYTDKVVVR